MERVGIRKLWERLVSYLRRAQAPGSSPLIVGRLTRPSHLSALAPELRAVGDLVAEGVVEWTGGKPRGAAKPPKVRRDTVSALVVEGRR